MKAMSRKLAIVCLAVITLFTSGCKKQAAEPEKTEGGLRIGYAEGVTVVDDANALQKQYDEMMEAAKQPGMTLTYTNDAFSTDGLNFDCFISNDAQNTYDMFIAIYGDDAFTDELYLSQLLRPGTAFETIKLNHALTPGDNTVYVAYTQVEEVDGEQQVHAQNIVTMVFHVTEN
jgi:protein involved in sex pheromone biosynthesis